MATLTFNYDDASAGYDIRLGSFDGTAIHSPYEMQNGDKFYFRTCKSSQTINGTTYESSQLDAGLTLTFDGDITIVGASGPQLTLSMNKFIIEYAASTPRVSVDVSTLPGWANLSAGSHNITVVAKADGYQDSAPSAAVQVTKAASTKTLKAGTYKWVDNPDLSGFPSDASYKTYELIFTSAGASFSSLHCSAYNSDWFDVGYSPNQDRMNFAGYSNNRTEWGYFDDDDNFWHKNTAYQTIALATDQQVSAEFYEWAITGGNLVAQPLL